MTTPPTRPRRAASTTTFAGLDPIGNVVTGVGVGSVTDTDAEDPSTALIVVAVGTGAEGNPDNGTVGVFFSGTYGQLRLMADGSYTYEVFQNDATVQALLAASAPLTDTFHYTIQDTGGAQRLRDLHDLGQRRRRPAAGQRRYRRHDRGCRADPVPGGRQRRPDPDAGAANTIAITGTVTSNGPGGTPINDGDATAAVIGNNIEVTLNGDFQTLTASESATVTVPYTLTGNAGETDTADLVVTVTGANDGLIANDDTGSMSENDAPTLFDVRAQRHPRRRPHRAQQRHHRHRHRQRPGRRRHRRRGRDHGGGRQPGPDHARGRLPEPRRRRDRDHRRAIHAARRSGGRHRHRHAEGDRERRQRRPGRQNFTFNGANAAIGNTALVVDDADRRRARPRRSAEDHQRQSLDRRPDPDGPGPLVVLAGDFCHE